MKGATKHILCNKNGVKKNMRKIVYKLSWNNDIVRKRFMEKIFEIKEENQKIRKIFFPPDDLKA